MNDATEERFDGWAWPDWNVRKLPGDEAPVVQTRRDRIASVVWPGVFLFYLAQPISQVFTGHRPQWQPVLVIALIVAFVVCYLYTCYSGQTASRRKRSLLIGLLCVFPIVLSVVLGPEELIFFTYAVSSALMLIPAFIGAALGFGSALSLIIGTWVDTGTPDFGTALILVVLTLAMFALGGLIRTVRQLRATQGTMARLAVAEERSRLARDLHDVLGHSLTTITVKAGLARRVLESSADRQRAIDEVRDVEELARQAMSDVRATVSGYRTASLPAELVGARAALSAAGIAADLPRAVDNVTAGLQETFAYVLREGVTNVIRHSGAGHCHVRLGDTWLEVRDDGHSAAEQVTTSRASGGGHGLSGLAERVAAVNGTLDAGPMTEGGFMLRVSAPMPSTARPTTDAQSAPGLSGQPAVGLA